MKNDRRIGIELGPPNILFLVIVGIVAVLATALLDLEPLPYGRFGLQSLSPPSSSEYSPTDPAPRSDGPTGA